MSLVTRCPTCGTTFRANRDQLAARGGRVRCGKCATAFDAIAGLVDAKAAPLALEPSPQLGLFDPARARAARAAAQAEAAAAVRADDAVPAFLEEEPLRRPTWPWLAAALVALAALAAQAALHFRADLALLVPEARPLLERACASLGCQVRLPRRPELMSIDSSDLQADPAREHVIVLNALLHNRAAFPQEYPSLELTLTDEADRAVVRRVLAPADYLERGRAAELLPRGIAPGGEVALRVHLDARGARATGYRLYMFFP